MDLLKKKKKKEKKRIPFWMGYNPFPVYKLGLN